MSPLLSDSSTSSQNPPVQWSARVDRQQFIKEALCRGSGCTECSCVTHSCLTSRKLQATGAVIATERHTAVCWIYRLCMQGHRTPKPLSVVASEGLCSLEREGGWVCTTVPASCVQAGYQSQTGSLKFRSRKDLQTKTPRSPPCHSLRHAMCVERQGTACSCTPGLLQLSERIPMPPVISQLPCSEEHLKIQEVLREETQADCGMAQIWVPMFPAAATWSFQATWCSKVSWMLGHN